MAMFDYVECLYPLPANLPTGDAFQTKDLTNALLHYCITEEGRLEESSGAEDRSAFTGTIHLVWSNVVASGPSLYTAAGEDAHFLKYAVTFVDGCVERVQELENRHEPSYEDGLRFNEERKAKWERERTAYEEALRARSEKACEEQATGTRELPC